MRATKPERLAAVLGLLRRKARPLTGAEVDAAFGDGDQTAALERLVVLGLVEPGPNTPARTWRAVGGSK